MDNIALVKLSALAIFFFLIFITRRNKLKSLYYLSIWFVVFLIGMIIYSYKEEFEGVTSRLLANAIPGYTFQDGNDIVIKRSQDGHFHILGYVNDVAVKFLIDTGASEVVLASELAKEIEGLRYTGNSKRFKTAGGRLTAKEIILDELSIGINSTGERDAIILKDFRAYIVEGDGQVMTTSLLGLSFLNYLESYQFKGDRMILSME